MLEFFSLLLGLGTCFRWLDDGLLQGQEDNNTKLHIHSSSCPLTLFLHACHLFGANVHLKALKDQIIKRLQRENNMIATAWYDLTSRLQSNHVVLQRRHDAPKSWINKQRHMVNGALVPPVLDTIFYSVSLYVCNDKTDAVTHFHSHTKEIES